MTNHMKVLIVGGGIGGLSAAISIILAGHSVTVFELQETIEEIGAGLQFSANATRILKKWGVDKAIEHDVVEPHNCIMRRWKDGKQIAKLPLHSDHRERYGSPFWDIHRHDLIMALFNRALALGADIKTNAKVVDIDFDAAKITLQNGEVFQGDLVVAADGLNSTCRKKFVPTEAPEFTGDMAFRILLNFADLPEGDPDFKALVEQPQVTYWLGPNGHAIVYVLKGGKQINLVAIAPDDLPQGIIRMPCHKTDVMAFFNDWDPLLCKIISQVETVYKWKLHKRPELGEWTHPSGRFVLLGDAVHPTLPYLSQGAGISLEDAAVLGHVLSENLPLPNALAKYEALRRPRTTRIVRAATAQQYWYHLHDGEEQQKRDAIIGAEDSCEGDPFLWREPTFAPWLYGYDAFKEAENATCNLSVPSAQPVQPVQPIHPTQEAILV